jgi:hypothetical protein
MYCSSLFSTIGKQSILAGLVTLGIAGGLVACGSKSESANTEDVSSVHENVIRTQTISFTLPVGVNPNNLAVGAAKTLTLNDRVKLSGVAAEATGTNGTIQVTNDAKVASLIAGGNVSIGDRSVVSGDITAGGNVTRSSSSSVTGIITAHATLGAPQQFQWTFNADTNSLGDVTANSGAALDLVPGTYGNLTLNSQSSVTLHTGTYAFGNIAINAQATLLVDSVRGPVQMYSSKQFTFNGSVATATAGIPQLLVGLTGTATATVQSPFTGVLLAPNATLNVQAALPVGHRAIFYSSALVLQPDTIINPYPFDWGFLIPSLEPTLPPSTPIHDMPQSPTNMPVAIDKDGGGTPTTTSSSPTVVKFTLPQSYPVEGGIIANGTVTFTFHNGSGAPVTCTYRGGSPTATPTTQTELNAGRILLFQSCSDGLPASTQRQGTSFTLTVTSTPGYPVTVNAPATATGACSDKLELLSAQQTQQMFDSFSWTAVRNQTWPGGDKTGHVAKNNPDGTPALYYGWVYLHTVQDAINLRKLYVHVLGTPLFQQELDQFAGMCGAISNPGDGVGAFVPVVIPGLTYNNLIDAFTAPNLSGNPQVFEAVIIRQVPAGAANPNGSISYAALANARFSYLDYEPKPLPDPANITQYHSVVHALVDVVQFVGQGLKDLGVQIERGLAAINRLFTGTVNVALTLNAVTGDTAFASNPIMLHGWGPLSGTPLGAPGMRVRIQQKFFNTFIPATSTGYTDQNGFVSIDAVKGQDPRGSGLCIQLRNDAATWTEFLLTSEVCDFRGFDPNSATLSNFQLTNFTQNTQIAAHISETHLEGHYQADDVYRWDQAVVGFTPQRATIMSGWMADTFSTHSNGFARPWTPCLNYGSVRDELIDATLTTGFLFGVVGEAIAAAASTFEDIIGRTDIFMATTSRLPIDRAVMSHEFGHFTFCGLLNKANGSAVNNLIWTFMINQENNSAGYNYVNEAFADFVSGQVAGGANYGWLNSGAVQGSGATSYCNNTGRCYDENLNGVATAKTQDPKSIGRIASMMEDAFDGRANTKFQNLPDNVDSWTGSNGALVFSPTTYGSQDSNLETVAISGQRLIDYAAGIASGLGDFGTGLPIDDNKIYGALNLAMVNDGVSSWCDRCRVLGLHSPQRGPDNDIGVVFSTCVNDPVVKSALGGTPPEASGRIDAATCQPCPAGQYSNKDGVCTVCTGTVVGNTCSNCPVNLTLDGNTLTSTSLVPSSSNGCPFWVELDNPQAAFTALNATSLSFVSGPVGLSGGSGGTQATCQRPYELDFGHLPGPTVDTTLTGTGVFTGCSGSGICITSCTGLPSKSFVAADVASGTPLLIAVPAQDPTKLLYVNVDIPIIVP